MIVNCYAEGTVSVILRGGYTGRDPGFAGAYVGGLVGCNTSDGMIDNCSASCSVIADVSGEFHAYAGGLVGQYTSYYSMDSCHATGHVTATSAHCAAYGGGLIGCLVSGGIYDSYATGDVNATSSKNTYAGGLVGQSKSSIGVVNCYATGNVRVESVDYSAYGGGLVGSQSAGQIKTSFATGNVSVSVAKTAYAGGLVGYTHKGTFNSKPVISGYRWENQIVQVNGEPTESNTHGTICTLDLFNGASFYVDTLGWRTSIWNFSHLDTANGHYPTLLL
jgi:hypothetical protein